MIDMPVDAAPLPPSAPSGALSRWFAGLFASRREWVNLTIYLLSAGLVIQNVVLIRSNQAYRHGAAIPDIEIGRQLGELPAATMTGVVNAVDLPEKPNENLLILTMSPSCPICKANTDKWLALTSRVSHSGKWRVLWVSRDSMEITKSFLHSVQLDPERMRAEPSHRAYIKLGLDKVPQMIAVTAGGVVDRVWKGRLEGKTESDLMSYLSSRAAFSQVQGVMGKNVPR